MVGIQKKSQLDQATINYLGYVIKDISGTQHLITDSKEEDAPTVQVGNN